MISILEALGYNVSGGKFVSARRSTLPHKQTSTSMPRSPTTSSCTKCSFYASKGVKGWVRRLFSNRTKDCHSCPYVDKAVIKARLEEQYPTDKWEHSYISESGGYVVTERQRINEGKQNSRERGIFNKEQSMCKVLAEHGHHVSHLRGKNRD